MSQENVEIARGAFEAFNSADLEAAMRVADPEIEWDASRAAPDGAVYRGRDEIQAAWMRFQMAWDEHSVEFECAFDNGDMVVLTYRERGRGKDSGIEVEQLSADLYEIHDGRIARVVSYTNLADALSAAGIEQ
jgi:ketosteroid isomerase-like protein